MTTDKNETDTQKMTIREALRAALRVELDRDEDVFIMGEDVGAAGGVYKVTEGLHDEFGFDRIRDTPISEAGIVGAGVGSALRGKRPIVEVMYSDFLGVCFEQIHNQAAKLRYMTAGQINMPLTIRTAEGGGGGMAAQHSGTYHGLLAQLPGIKVVAPATPAGAYGLLRTSIQSDDPVIFFENKLLYGKEGSIPVDESYSIPLGEASIATKGDDVTVLASQRLFQEALSLADEMDQSLEVIDPQSIYPLDTETISASVEKTGRLVIADESPMSYGFHAEVGMRIQENCFFSLDTPIERVGTPDTPIPFSPRLEKEIIPGKVDIRSAIERINNGV